MKNELHPEQLFAELRKCTNHDFEKHFTAVCNVFPILLRSQQHDGATEFHTWAEANAAKHPVKFVYAEFLLAWLDFLSDRHEDALRKVIELKKKFEALNDIGGAACCLAMMGGVYRTIGNYDLTLKTLLESYRMLIPLGMHTHFLFAASYNIGYMYFELNNDAEALHYFENTRLQADEAGDMIWSNYALHGLGKLYLSQKKYDEAKSFFDQAVRSAEKNGYTLGICNSLTELANYHFQTGNFAEAERLHTEALTLRLENNFIGGAVTSYIRLGEILIKDSKEDEAMATLTKGLALAEEIKVKPKIYQAHFLIAGIYECRNDFVKSLYHFRKFHEIKENVEVEDAARRIKNVQVVFEAEQAQKENVIIREQKAEIQKKNAQLQETIDALTLARVSRKARAITFGIALLMFIFEDTILHFALHLLNSENYFASMAVKIGIIFSLKPINTTIEHYLMKQVLRKRKAKDVAHAGSPEPGEELVVRSL